MTNDTDAEFTALVQRQSRFVFQVAYAVLLNAHDAEDAVQETFLKLYRNHGWREAQNERAFLARAAWRVAVDLRPRIARSATSPVRSESAERPESQDWSDSEDAAPSLEPGPEQVLVAADQHALVHSLMDTLPEELRLPLLLSSFEELNSREIAAVLGIPEGTVRTRLQRARQLLREKLAKLRVRNQEARHA